MPSTCTHEAAADICFSFMRYDRATLSVALEGFKGDLPFDNDHINNGLAIPVCFSEETKFILSVEVQGQ